MRIIDRIDELLKEKGLLAKQLADAVGVSTSNVSEWRKDRAKPAAEVVAKIADYLNVSTDYLLGRSDIRRPGEIAAASSTVPYQDLPQEVLEKLESYKLYLLEEYRKSKKE